jgi:hypothetical protein
MNSKEIQNSIHKSILILCHRRTVHLEVVLRALEGCNGVSDFTIVFVVQDPTEPVLQVIQKFSLESKLLEIDGSNYNSSAQAINGNLFYGLDFCFNQLKTSFVVVLEDDIVLSRDALSYFDSVIGLEGNNSAFRGVNAFSETIAPPYLENSFVRTNYGLGWGWAINSKLYSRILKFWSGTENNHWDFIFEPYLRTGYVINPFRSRVLNIGFDESATHTSGNRDLGIRMSNSFNSASGAFIQPVSEANFDYYWMGKKINYSNVSFVQLFCRKLIFRAFTVLGDSRSYHKIRYFLSQKI